MQLRGPRLPGRHRRPGGRGPRAGQGGRPSPPPCTWTPCRDFPVSCSWSRNRGGSPCSETAKKLARPFLDIRERVDDLGERGLLSIAFPANYKKSRRFYVFYTQRNGDIRVDEFKRSRKTPARAVASSGRRGAGRFHTRRPPTTTGDSSSSGPTAISTSRRVTGAATPMPPPTATCCWGSSCGSIPASGAVAPTRCPRETPTWDVPRPKRDLQLRPSEPMAILV